jgi:hypothetical protein
MFLLTTVDGMTLRRRQLAHGLALVVIGGHVAAAIVHAQSQETVNAVVAASVRSIESRMDALERQDMPSRLRVVEENVGETKWLVRGVAGAFVVQIVSKLLENRRKRDAED